MLRLCVQFKTLYKYCYFIYVVFIFLCYCLLCMKEIACGCVPWRRTEDKKIEVLMILRNGGFWEFPKGKKEKNESDKDTALRELKEEVNLDGDISMKDIISANYSFTRNDIQFEKIVRLYLCEVSLMSKVVVEKKEVTDHKWLSVENLAQQATYPETKEMARVACKLLLD